MKKKSKAKPETLPVIPAGEVAKWMAKTATVNIRLTPGDKAAMERAASSLGMTVTEYLVRCHSLVARHLR